MQALVENSHVFEPMSYVIYYVHPQTREKCIIAGNHRIAAKKLVAEYASTGQRHYAHPPNLSLAVIKVSSSIDSVAVLEASASTLYTCSFL